MPGCESRIRRRRLGTSVEDADGKRREAHGAGAQADQLCELAAGRIHRRRDRDRVAREHLAGLGEAHAASGADEQRNPEPGFRATQVLADRRLAVSEGAGRPADGAVLGDRAHDAH